MGEVGEKRYALLMCGEDSEYLLKMHGGCYGIFGRVLAEEGERWDLYKVVQGHFPENHHLSLYDGFVITGSCYDAHANDPWILDLLQLVLKLDTMHKKILGICFGHQVPTSFNFYFHNVYAFQLLSLSYVYALNQLLLLLSLRFAVLFLIFGKWISNNLRYVLLLVDDVFIV